MILLATVLVPAGNFAFLGLLPLLVRISTWDTISLSGLARRTLGLVSLGLVCRVVLPGAEGKTDLNQKKKEWDDANRIFMR